VKHIFAVLAFRRYTYEVAPVFIMMEKELLKMFCDYVGYKEGDGTFSPGTLATAGLIILSAELTTGHFSGSRFHACSFHYKQSFLFVYGVIFLIVYLVHS